MNQQERDELRAKHHVQDGDDGSTYCKEDDSLWPCDVIRVLDAWENERNMVALTDLMREQGYPE